MSRPTSRATATHPLWRVGPAFEVNDTFPGLHSTLFTLHYELYALPSTVYTLQSHAPYFIHTLQSAPRSSLVTAPTTDYTPHIAHLGRRSTAYSLQATILGNALLKQTHTQKLSRQLPTNYDHRCTHGCLLAIIQNENHRHDNPCQVMIIMLPT